MRKTLILITIAILFGCGEKMPSDQEMIDNFKNNRKDFEKLYDLWESDEFSYYPSLLDRDSSRDSMEQALRKELKISPEDQRQQDSLRHIRDSFLQANINDVKRSLQRKRQYDSLMHKLGIKSLFGGFVYFSTGGIGWSLEKSYTYSPDGIDKLSGYYHVIVGKGIETDINDLRSKIFNGQYTIYKEIEDGWYIVLEYDK